MRDHGRPLEEVDFPFLPASLSFSPQTQHFLKCGTKAVEGKRAGILARFKAETLNWSLMVFDEAIRITDFLKCLPLSTYLFNILYNRKEVCIKHFCGRLKYDGYLEKKHLCDGVVH